MKSIVRRDTGEGYREYLKDLAVAEGVDANDAAAIRRMDRKRGKKMSNEDWVSPSDGEAEITRLKDAGSHKLPQWAITPTYGRGFDQIALHSLAEIAVSSRSKVVGLDTGC